MTTADPDRPRPPYPESAAAPDAADSVFDPFAEPGTGWGPDAAAAVAAPHAPDLRPVVRVVLGASATVTAAADAAPVAFPATPLPSASLWWDDPRPRCPLPPRPPGRPSDDWPRPPLPPDAPLPPYPGCRWPRACALLGRRLRDRSALPCRCDGGVRVAASCRAAEEDDEWADLVG